MRIEKRLLGGRNDQRQIPIHHLPKLFNNPALPLSPAIDDLTYRSGPTLLCRKDAPLAVSTFGRELPKTEIDVCARFLCFKNVKRRSLHENMHS